MVTNMKFWFSAKHLIALVTTFSFGETTMLTFEICNSTTLDLQDYPIGYVISPNFPNNYPNEKRCSLLLENEKSQRIKISFETFLLEQDTTDPCGRDWIQWSVPSALGSWESSRYCGNNTPLNTTLPYNTHKITFVSDKSITAPGFKLRFDATDHATKIDDFGKTDIKNRTATEKFRKQLVGSGILTTTLKSSNFPTRFEDSGIVTKTLRRGDFLTEPQESGIKKTTLGMGESSRQTTPHKMGKQIAKEDAAGRKYGVYIGISGAALTLGAIVVVGAITVKRRKWNKNLEAKEDKLVEREDSTSLKELEGNSEEGGFYHDLESLDGQSVPDDQDNHYECTSLSYEQTEFCAASSPFKKDMEKVKAIKSEGDINLEAEAEQIEWTENSFYDSFKQV